MDVTWRDTPNSSEHPSPGLRTQPAAAVAGPGYPSIAPEVVGSRGALTS